jgi:hypothetical protein
VEKAIAAARVESPRIVSISRRQIEYSGGSEA